MQKRLKDNDKAKDVQSAKKSTKMGPLELFMQVQEKGKFMLQKAVPLMWRQNSLPLGLNHPQDKVETEQQDRTESEKEERRWSWSQRRCTWPLYQLLLPRNNITIMNCLTQHRG